MKIIEKAPSYEQIFSNTKNFFELLANPEFNALVNHINEQYYYWDKVKYLKTPLGVSAEDVWIVARYRRTNTPYIVRFGKHQFSWFLNAQTQELLHLFDLNIGGSLQAKGVIPKEEKNRYLISSIMEEAIASSQIEGAVTTRKAAKEMLRKNKNPRNKSEQMIVNNYFSIQKILEWKNEDLTMENLLELHRLVTHKTMDDVNDEGRVRADNEVKVIDVLDGEIVHYPPEYEELPELMKALFTFFNQDQQGVFIHPIVKACIIHFMIGYIHPFVDGNGRTARALFYWYLLKKGYWLTEYLSISRLILKSKNAYAKSFVYSEIDENDITYFINYKLRTMKLAYESLREYIQRKIDEKHKIADFIRLQNVNERQALILKWVYEEPAIILSVKEVETRLSVSNQTARTDLLGLVNNGFLEPLKLNKKTQAFGKSKIFDELIRNK